MAAVLSKAQALTTETDLVQLDQDHPGFRDPVYRARRNQIARIAMDYAPGDPLPCIEYSAQEHGVWRTVWENLAPLQADHAFTGYLDACRLLGLDRRAIPQLSRVNEVLVDRSGFRMLPVAGLIASRAFLGRLNDRIFLSTQYIRHHSRPLYTPEPDIVHELIGHATGFCDRRIGDLNRLFGQAAMRATDAEIVTLERLYWYTLEFGVVEEGDDLRAYGAGLLSSFGELGRFKTDAVLRPFTPEEAAAMPYDPTDYQAQLFVVPSIDQLIRTLEKWFTRWLAR